MAGNKKNNERVYVAISYYEVNPYSHRPDYQVLGVTEPGKSKQRTEFDAEDVIMRDYQGIYAETLRKNLFVVTESAAKRSYKTAYNHWLESDEC